MDHRCTQKFTILIAASCLTFLTFLNVAHAKGVPDPVELLQGVEAARLQIPPSHLKIRYINKDPFINNQNDYFLDFSGDKRRFVADPKSGNEASYYCTAFDGAQARVYGRHFAQAEIRTLGEANIMLLFDPRLLGISPYFQWKETPEILIPYRKGGKIELIGRELIGANQTWHVRITKVPSSFDSDFWIDDTADFRVYRHDMNGVETFSYYENSHYPWLPSRVESKEYNSAHQLTDERDCIIIEAKANVKFSDDVWTFSGLNLPKGTAIANVSTHERLGYWDGSKIDPNPLTAKSRPPAKWSILMIVLLFIIFPAWYLFRSKPQIKNHAKSG